MPEEKLSAETQESIRSYCRKLSIAYDLDEDIQEELADHIEDKLLSYLTGEEKLSEQDGLVLVREHFGKPEHIRSLLEEVHEAQTKGTLVRRIGAVVIATMGVELLHPFWNDMCMFIRENITWSIFYVNALILFVPMVLLFLLMRWQKKTDDGQVLWYQRIKPASFIGLFVLLAVLQVIFSLYRRDKFSNVQ